MNNLHFMQWNCRGLLRNIDDVNHFMDELRPIALALQETHLRDHPPHVLRRHKVFRKDRLCSNSSGGVTVVVQSGVACSEVPLCTPLEAVAVRLLLDRLITVVSLYLPPNVPLQLNELQRLVGQLPQTFLILGDFNAHHPMWGSIRQDSRGGIVERFLLSSGTCLLNGREPTFFSAAHNSFTSIDLSIASPSLFPHFTWKVLDNPFGSDHFPIVLESNVQLPSLLKRIPRWKLDKADWSLFGLHSMLDASLLSAMSPEDATLYVTEQILSAAQLSIPRTSGNVHKKCKPWWNEECATTRADQNRAWSKFRRCRTSRNLARFRQRRAKAHWTRKQAKWKSWMKYVSSLTSFVPAKEAWDRYRKINGYYRCLAIPTFNAPSSSLVDIGNILGEHFYNISSSANYSNAFTQFKLRAERQNISMSGAGLEPYNQPFTQLNLK